MGSREKILARIRHRMGRGGGGPSSAEREALSTWLARHPRGPLPETGPDLAARFLDKAKAASCTTDRIAQEADVPAAVARYLKEAAVAGAGCVWPALAHLDWAGAGLALEPRAANGEDGVGVTGVFCAIAETGTLMLCSGRATPASASLLPETHVAVVPVRRLVAHMEDAWDLARAELGALPRAVNFVSGPSRTADIEQTIVLGAHGPARVHVVLVG